MTSDALIQANVLLEPLLDCSDGVLVSGPDTLRRGSLYVMGYNPGGSPEAETSTVGSSLEAEHREWNDWTSEGYGDGYSPLQFRIRTVFEELGADPCATFSTNALFVRSPQAAGLDGAWQLWWTCCWPVHQLFLRVVQPRVIVCLGCGGGSSAWTMLRHTRPSAGRRYVPNWETDEEAAADGKWEPAVSLDIGGDEPHSCAVLGLPHPSPRVRKGWPLSSAAKLKIEQARCVAYG